MKDYVSPGLGICECNGAPQHSETGLKKGGKERSFFLLLLQISASWKSSREEICGNKITQSHCPAQTGERRLQSVQDLSPAHGYRLDVCICKTLAEPLLSQSVQHLSTQ